MLAKNACELVGRFFEQCNGVLEKEQLKQGFIHYVFSTYQEQVVAAYDLDFFHDHLVELRLSNCRKDFDLAVEEWYATYCECDIEGEDYHDLLFQLVKEIVIHYKPQSRDELVKDMSLYLTSPDQYMERWRGKERTASMYFQYLYKLGIRTYLDIEAVVDAWLIEHPDAFDEHHQNLLAQPPRRGRPNNLELAVLMEKAQEMKPGLTEREKERMRKIYYYHRNTLTTLGMIEKFKNYIDKSDDDIANSGSIQVM
ncbi:hypothetical protein ACI7RC_23530 [Brevibacillus sp. B_LB10_24]|uniref:hypothetical protein n=1 Tax=Brevibacillus sp. B_LB10_24 TaxID=3380645 RepID=UPI0038BC8D91